eukprot:1160871-Pelagomonas_calceolata.AAC.3
MGAENIPCPRRKRAVENMEKSSFSKGGSFFLVCSFVPGNAGKECADAVAKYQANQANSNEADTGMPGAGPGGNQFSRLFWLPKEEKGKPIAGTSTAPAPSPKNTYLPNFQNALKSHHDTHTRHRLGYANSKTGYYSLHQTLLPHVDTKTNNAFRNMPCISSPMKRTILQYRTGALYTQKHAVHFKRSTNPLCPFPGCQQLDSALHMLSGCQNHNISSMKTERHNVSERMIIKALSKSPLGAGLANTTRTLKVMIGWHSMTFESLHIHRTDLYPLNSLHAISLRDLDPH